jgi:hypothetical protein
MYIWTQGRTHVGRLGSVVLRFDSGDSLVELPVNKRVVHITIGVVLGHNFLRLVQSALLDQPLTRSEGYQARVMGRAHTG